MKPASFIAVLMMTLGGCAEEQVSVVYKSPFDGLEGAERGGKPIGPRAADPTAKAGPKTDDELVRTDPHGNKTLVLLTPRHVLYHLRTLLTAPEDKQAESSELFQSQLIADAMKRRFLMEGHEIADTWAYFKDHQRAVIDLLDAMPNGELSIDVAFERNDDHTYQLRVRRSRARVLEFESVWVVREGGRYKLLWAR